MTTERKYMPIINRGEVVKIYFDEIVYIESESRKIIFHTDRNNYSTYRKIEDVTALLPDSFHRCHKSCIINMEKVREMRDCVVYFENGMNIRMCRDKFAKSIQAYKGYLIRNA